MTDLRGLGAECKVTNLKGLGFRVPGGKLELQSARWQA